jgi:hypothetical protein
MKAEVQEMRLTSIPARRTFSRGGNERIDINVES